MCVCVCECAVLFIYLFNAFSHRRLYRNEDKTQFKFLTASAAIRHLPFFHLAHLLK